MKVLQIDSSPSANSVSRELTAAIVARVSAQHPGAQVSHRDLNAQPVAHLSTALLAAMRPAPGTTPDLTPAVQAELALNETLITEFMAADVVVIGAPMYNFSIPTQLKAWIDRVAQAGRTFSYSAAGPEGLAKGKTAIIVSSRGGKYQGTAVETVMDHQEAYLKAVLGFFGITDVQVVRAEGLAMGPDAKAQALDSAATETSKLLASLKAGRTAEAVA